MADFEDFIETNEILKNYFNQFPKQLLKLCDEVITQGKNYYQTLMYS